MNDTYSKKLRRMTINFFSLNTNTFGDKKNGEDYFVDTCFNIISEGMPIVLFVIKGFLSPLIRNKFLNEGADELEVGKTSGFVNDLMYLYWYWCLARGKHDYDSTTNVNIFLMDIKTLMCDLVHEGLI